MNKLGIYFIFFATVKILTSCANAGAPTGGPVDKEPPVIKESYPENGSINFSNDKIEITPQCIPIEHIPSFHNAKRRFFSSATLVDDSHLVKDFGASCEAVSAPLKDPPIGRLRLSTFSSTGQPCRTRVRCPPSSNL